MGSIGPLRVFPPYRPAGGLRRTVWTPLPQQVIKVYLANKFMACASAPKQWQKVKSAKKDFQLEGVTDFSSATVHAPT